MSWWFAGACAMTALWACYVRLAHVENSSRFDLGELARGLGDKAERAAVVRVEQAMRLEGPSWECDLLQKLLDARDKDERVALVNEQIGELDWALAWGELIPRTAARAAFLAPMCVAFFLLAEGGATANDVAALFAWSAAGSLGAIWAEKLARKRVAALRAGADAFVSHVMRGVSIEIDSPTEKAFLDGSAVDPPVEPV